jgi:CBS domain-containing protein
MIVEEAMSRRVVTCRPTEAMQDVVKKMWDEDLGCVLVTDAAMRPLGVVTDRDLCMGAYMRGKAFHELEVSACAQTELETCRPDEPLLSLVERLGQLCLRRLPEVDGEGRLLGVMSLGAAARAAERVTTARERNEILQAVAVALAAITRPRDTEPVVELAPAARAVSTQSAAKADAAKASPKKAAKAGGRRGKRKA